MNMSTSLVENTLILATLSTSELALERKDSETLRQKLKKKLTEWV